MIQAEQRLLDTPHGQVLGASYQWSGGQYCALHTPHGLVGCGIFDVACANHFGMALAIARGTPQAPLRKPEDLYPARIVAVSEAAARAGIEVGMTGLEAVGKMMAADGATR